MERKDENKQKQEQRERMQQAARGQLSQPDLQLSTYQSWDEVGLQMEMLLAAAARSMSLSDAL
jgi:hypothetical protein